MSVPDSNTVMLLTEHLGFPPITVVDDIINAVNEIMYKCTSALEKYLHSKESKVINEKNKKAPGNNKGDDSIIIEGGSSLKGGSNKNEENLDEIEVGTAKLETLLESYVDRNFDLFELYTIRNIFNIPNDLVDNGWVRLPHYKNIKMQKNIVGKLSEVNKAIYRLEQELKFQLFLKKRILEFLKKAKKLLRLLKLYRENLKFLVSNPVGIRNSAISRESINALRSLSPINESIFFLKTEAIEIYKVVKVLDDKFTNSIKDVKLKPNQRDLYVDTKSYKLLQLYSNRNNDDGDVNKTKDGDIEMAEQAISIKLNRIRKSSKDVSDLKKVNESLVIKD